MIAGQLMLVLILITLILYFYNRQLKQRNQKLVDKARQLLAQQKQTTQEVTTLASHSGTISNGPSQIEVIDAETNALLNQALTQTETRLKELALDSIDLHPNLSTEQMIAALRYHFLESEKKALPFSNDPHLLWQTLEQNLDKIYQRLKSIAVSAQRPQLTAVQSSTKNDSTDQPELMTPEALEDAFSAMGVAEGSNAEKSDTPQARIKRHVKGLTQLMDQQRRSLEELDKIRIIHSEPHQHEFIQEYQEQVRQMERLLDESETCIKTLESEVEQAQQKIMQLESQL
jgi:hypothetical protein